MKKEEVLLKASSLEVMRRPPALLLLAIVAASAVVPRGLSASECSREDSRTAQDVLDKYLLPLVTQVGYNLSSQCRLFPELHRYYEHERHKKEVRKGQWKCSYCQKAFRNEDFLDRHLENRHNDMIPANATHCLADHCNVLHCQHHTGGMDHDRTHCKAPRVGQIKHACEELAHNCFPPEESDLARNIYGFFLEQFCEAHTCDRGRRLFPKGSLVYQPVNWGYYTVVVVVLCGLGFFYCSTWQHWAEMRAGRGDLRRAAATRQSWATWMFGKKKAY